MCHSKFFGGMGFRDLESFNKAMLAKISWRIIKAPNSLMAIMARVLRGKYFSNVPFLKATSKRNASIVWKSILWGRSLFIEGYRWKVGSGKRVYIDEDHWLLNDCCWKPLNVHQDLKGKKVMDILNPDGSWK